MPELGPEARGSQPWQHNNRLTVGGGWWRALNTPSPRVVESFKHPDPLWGDGDPGDRISEVPRRFWFAAQGRTHAEG